MWTKEETLTLIEYYEQCRSLYDVRDRNYFNRSRRNDMLIKIRDAMKNMKPNVTAEDIKAKIKSLRSQYAHEKALEDKSKRSGSGVDDLYQPKLWCFRNLTFLDVFTNIRPGVSTCEQNDISTSTMSGSETPSATVSSTPSTSSTTIGTSSPSSTTAAISSPSSTTMATSSTSSTNPATAHSGLKMKKAGQNSYLLYFAPCTSSTPTITPLTPSSTFVRTGEAHSNFLQSIPMKRKINEEDHVSETSDGSKISHEPQTSTKKFSKEDVFGRFVAAEMKEIKNTELYNRIKRQIQLTLMEGIEEQTRLDSEVKKPLEKT